MCFEIQERIGHAGRRSPGGNRYLRCACLIGPAGRCDCNGSSKKNALEEVASLPRDTLRRKLKHSLSLRRICTTRKTFTTATSTDCFSPVNQVRSKSINT